MTSPAVIRIIGLSKSFGNHEVLKDFNLTLRKGENVVVLGKSGSGKSVLIKCIVGLLEPDAGVIEVNGKNVAGLHHDELDKVRARVGFLFQSNALYDSMSVKQNLEFPLRRHWIKMSHSEVTAAIHEKERFYKSRYYVAELEIVEHLHKKQLEAGGSSNIHSEEGAVEGYCIAKHY